jgi:hypothetical protein
MIDLPRSEPAPADPIADWWQAFVLQAPRIDRLFCREDEWDLPAWMHEYLGAVDPNLMWEFGPAVRGSGHRLVITPESRRDLRPLVRELLSRAPDLPNWEFYEYRLPEDFDQMLATVEGRTGRDVRSVQVQAKPGEFNRIDLLFTAFDFDDEEDAFSSAFVATETLLGEEVLDRWVGEIEVSSNADDAASPPIDLCELPAAVDRLIQQIQDSLPNRPWHDLDTENARWTSFEINREQAGEYPEQSDLYVGITALPDMFSNALSGVPFDSVRFSRFGEQFCYLKIDGTDESEQREFNDRAEIEDALDEQLRPARLGSVVGGGTGCQYSYIELALTDVDQAWPVIRSILKGGRLTARTWLLFHDSDLQSQWLGLYDHTPPPPMWPPES